MVFAYIILFKFQDIFWQSFSKSKVFDLLINENEGIYKENESLGFDGTFGQLVDQASCPRILSK